MVSVRLLEAGGRLQCDLSKRRADNKGKEAAQNPTHTAGGTVAPLCAHVPNA